jgi:hydroxyethylthiazole kinase-like uncharacterized protein yjeF
MKILTRQQIRELDTYTINNENISGLQLMEQAGVAFSNWFEETFPERDYPIFIICGPGNNGGDGMVIARLLFDFGYNIRVIRVKSESYSQQALHQYERIKIINGLFTHTLSQPQEIEWDLRGCIIIDALLGTGINRPLEGIYLEWIKFLNGQKQAVKIAVDIPSGLAIDHMVGGEAFEAQYTFGIEVPKLAYMMPEHQHQVGHWFIRKIGLSQTFIQKCKTEYYTLEQEDILNFIQIPNKFDHKGINGHVLLVGGSKGKAGAIALAGRGGLRTGAGLISLGIPNRLESILQGLCPEAMCYSLGSGEEVEQIPESLERFQAIGVGPGLGQSKKTGHWLEQFLNKYKGPLVLDADALNLISYLNLHEKIPKGSIITPHFKELERLAGPVSNHWERLKQIKNMAQNLGIIVILKGAHSAIALPNGFVFFNTTGNPGMAKGGSGDILTGILTGLLAKGYSTMEAAFLGVFAHGKAGDLAAEYWGITGMQASDILHFLPKVWQVLEKKKNNLICKK